jgi:sulfoxide reductase heme-binding subunit YedZ
LAKRPYTAFGFFAWLLMLPLAVTSTRFMQHRLRHNWQRLHQLACLAALLVCLHLVRQVRSDVGEALLYSAVVTALLAWRVRRRSLKQQASMSART